MNYNKKGFTLIELLVVMGILGVVMSVTILVINPAEHLKRARDTQRISDLNTLNSAINIYIANSHNILDSITPNDCYYSATNGFLKIDSSGFCPYGTPHFSDFRAIDGTGWLPINFGVDNNSLLSVLPIDPSNNTMYYETYVEGGSPVVRFFFPKAFGYIGGGGTSTYQYFYSYGFIASSTGTYKFLTKMESKTYQDKMANDGGNTDEYFEMGSDLSLIIEPGPTAPLATTTTTAPPSPKYMFVTSDTWDGNLGGLSGADAKCQTAATNAGLSGNYIAWVSTFDSYIYYRIPGGNYYYILTDNVRIADSFYDLVGSPLQVAINKNEFGNILNTTTWTGSDSYGDVGTSTCSDWTNSTSGVTANIGNSSATDGTWSDNGTAACNSLKSLYCIEQ